MTCADSSTGGEESMGRHHIEGKGNTPLTCQPLLSSPCHLHIITLYHHTFTFIQSIPCLRHPAIIPRSSCISHSKSNVLCSSPVALLTSSFACVIFYLPVLLDLLIVNCFILFHPCHASSHSFILHPHFPSYMILSIIFAHSDCLLSA